MSGIISRVSFALTPSEQTIESAKTLGKKAGAVVVFATILPAVAKGINKFASAWESKTNLVGDRTWATSSTKTDKAKFVLRKIGQVAARLFGLSTALELLSRKPAQAYDWASSQFTKHESEDIINEGEVDDTLLDQTNPQKKRSQVKDGQENANEDGSSN